MRCESAGFRQRKPAISEGRKIMKSPLPMCKGVAVLLSLVVLAGVAVAGIRVPLEKVPAPAVKLVKDRFPKAEIRYVDKEPDDHYEFAMKEGQRVFDVGVTAEGKLLNVKEELPPADLPKVVKDGVQKKFPGAEIAEAEKITTGDGATA